MRKIPVDRPADAVGKARLRQPAELRVDLRGVDGIAQVMSLPVGDVGDEAFGLSELAADQAHDVDVAHLVVTADVVHLTDAPAADHKVDGLAVVGDIQPVAHVQSLPVHRQRPLGEGAHDHERDELFRKLIRPVVIRAARDRDRQAVGASVRAHEQVSRGLGAAVGRARVQRRLLGEQQLRPIERQVAVDLVGRDLMEADVSVFAAGVHEHGRADDVRLHGLHREELAGGHLFQRCRVEDVVDAGHGIPDGLRVAHVADVELDLAGILRVVGLQLVAHVVLLLLIAGEDADLADVGGQEMLEHRMPKAARAAGDE